MKQLLLVCIFFLLSLTISARNDITTTGVAKVEKDSVKFTKSGVVATVPILKQANNKPLVDSSGLKQNVTSQTEALKKDISARLTATVKKIQSNKSLYASFFPTSGPHNIDALLAEYDKAITWLNTDNGKLNTTGITNLIKASLDTVKKVKILIDYEPNRKSALDAKVYVPDVANIFYATYYNAVLNDTTNNPIYNSMSKLDLFPEIRSFAELIDKLEEESDKPLHIIYPTNTNAELTVHTLYKLFEEKWIGQLLWLNKGEPQLNPFDQTSKALLAQNPGWTISGDPEKTYQRYLDGVIERKIKTDTTSNYQAFKKLLIEKNTLKNRELYAGIRDSLETLASKQLEILKTNYKLLNHLIIPTDSLENIRIIDANKKAIEDVIVDLDFFGTNQKLNFLIHNIRSNQQIKLVNTEKKTIAAEGKTEQAIGDLIGQAASVYTLLNPHVSLLSGISKNVVTPKDSTQEGHGLNPQDSLSVPQDTTVIVFEEDPPTLKKAKDYLLVLESGTLPPDALEMAKSSAPSFYSKLLRAETGDSLAKYTYVVRSITKKDTTTLETIKFKTGKHVRFTISAGMAYTFNTQVVNRINQDSYSNTNFTGSSQAFRGTAFLNLYLFGKGLRKPDDHFFPARKFVAGRFLLQTGVGIPKPLENIYTGIGFNMGPGLLLSTGAHWYAQKRYNIRNSVLIDERNIYKPGLYISLSIDPGNFAKALGLFGDNK